LAGELLHTPYADTNFHGHRPAVRMKKYSLWGLDWDESLGTFSRMFGATRITSPAYQKWSTRGEIKKGSWGNVQSSNSRQPTPCEPYL